MEFVLESEISSKMKNRDKKVCTLTYANTVAFYDPLSMTKIKEFQTPTQINSAHLHPQLKYFVAGGHDFKIYKFDYETGQECDSYKGTIFWITLTNNNSNTFC